MNIVDVTNENFKDIVLSAGKPFILDFWAPWCVYCRKLSPVLDFPNRCPIKSTSEK